MEPKATSTSKMTMTFGLGIREGTYKVVTGAYRFLLGRDEVYGKYRTLFPYRDPKTSGVNQTAIEIPNGPSKVVGKIVISESSIDRLYISNLGPSVCDLMSLA